jgi:hypothetical protein
MHAASGIVQHAADLLVARCGAGMVLHAPADTTAYWVDLLTAQPSAQICVFRPDTTAALSTGPKALAGLDLGVGLYKRAALLRIKPAAELARMARIKAAFDAEWRLNSGKIFALPDDGSARFQDRGPH